MGARPCFVGFATTTLVALFVAPTALAQTAEREVIVHLNAPPGVTLEREDGDDHWTEVCFAPCDLSFSTRAHYRVGGGIRDSKPFTLHETSPGLEVVVVEPRSRGGHAFGDVLIGIGSAITFAGGVLVMLGALAEHCPDGAGRGNSCGGIELLTPGLAVALVGVGVIVLGVDLVVVNHASRVHPESRPKAHDDVNRVQTILFDLSRRRESSWTPPSVGGAVPIFSYRF
jgi:hypothetical protein